MISNNKEALLSNSFKSRTKICLIYYGCFKLYVSIIGFEEAKYIF